MEPKTLDSIDNFRYHIHNYSPLAVKAFINEVKKHPIIYTEWKSISNRNQLIDDAWSRIIVAILEKNNKPTSSSNLEYWDQCFRLLWKWMVGIYVNDRAFVNVDHWLNFLDFLEPFVSSNCSLSDICVMSNQCKSNFQLEVLPLNTKMVLLQPDNHIILWLKKHSESINSTELSISICMQTQKSLAPKIPPSLEIMLYQDEIASSSEVEKNKQLSLTFKQAKLHNNYRPFRMFFEEDDLIPFMPTVSLQSLVDEDYRYIMSLYSKLTKLTPARKAEVKKLMVLSLFDAL